MTRQAKEALLMSIEKWEANLTNAHFMNVRGLIDNMIDFREMICLGVGDCPLCQLYHRKECIGCPIYKAAGSPCCRDTPYLEVYRWSSKVHETFYDDKVVSKSLIQKGIEVISEEVEFLYSLLDAE